MLRRQWLLCVPVTNRPQVHPLGIVGHRPHRQEDHLHLLKPNNSSVRYQLGERHSNLLRVKNVRYLEQRKSRILWTAKKQR